LRLIDPLALSAPLISHANPLAIGEFINSIIARKSKANGTAINLNPNRMTRQGIANTRVQIEEIFK
jgi:hypothetical protein